MTLLQEYAWCKQVQLYGLHNADHAILIIRFAFVQLGQHNTFHSYNYDLRNMLTLSQIVTQLFAQVLNYLMKSKALIGSFLIYVRWVDKES